MKDYCVMHNVDYDTNQGSVRCFGKYNEWHAIMYINRHIFTISFGIMIMMVSGITITKCIKGVDKMSAMNLFIIEGWNHTNEEFEEFIEKYCRTKNIGVMINHKYKSYEYLLNELGLKQNYFSLTDAPDDYECMELICEPHEISLDVIQKKYEVFDEIIKLFFEKYEIKKIILYLAMQHIYAVGEFDTIKKIKSSEFIPMLYDELEGVSRKHNVCYTPDLCIEIER